MLEFVQPKNNINIKTNIIFFLRVLSSLGFTVLAVEEDEFFSFFFLFAMLEEAIGGWLVLAMVCWLSESNSGIGLDGEGEAMVCWFWLSKSEQ